jgi:hypothetical protein
LREDLQAARELAAKRQEALKLLEARSNENAVRCKPRCIFCPQNFI